MAKNFRFELNKYTIFTNVNFLSKKMYISRIMLDLLERFKKWGNINRISEP